MSRPQKEVIVIPATIDTRLAGNKSRLLRVASYSRVSTNFEEQLTSFYAQKQYYTDLILKTPGWELVGTYADEGISGVSAEKRPEFMKLIRHCKNGKVDMIITKSLSRFSRNTLDTVKYVRKLKDMGIGIYFEKENLNTLEETSEFIMTILASLAQEESNSLSLNVKMGKRMAMQEGKVSWNFKTAYGFQEGEDGDPIAHPAQAKIVRRIFQEYLSGESERIIAEKLNAEHISCRTKAGVWQTATINRILQNERYCGDVILQKTYVADPLSKKVKVNNGELPKVHIKNNHVALVSHDTFDRAMRERTKRTSKRKLSVTEEVKQGKYSSLYALGEILICGHCKTPYSRKTWRKRDGSLQYVWRCSKRMKHGTKYCDTSVTLDEESLHDAIMAAILATADADGSLVPTMAQELEKSMVELAGGGVDTEKISRQIADLKAEVMTIVAEKNMDAEKVAQLQELSDEASELNRQLEEHNAKNDRAVICEEVAQIRDKLNTGAYDYSTYDDKLVRQLIYTIEVVDEGHILIRFKDGVEYRQMVEARVKPAKKSA